MNRELKQPKKVQEKKPRRGQLASSPDTNSGRRGQANGVADLKPAGG